MQLIPDSTQIILQTRKVCFPASQTTIQLHPQHPSKHMMSVTSMPRQTCALQFQSIETLNNARYSNIRHTTQQLHLSLYLNWQNIIKIYMILSVERVHWGKKEGRKTGRGVGIFGILHQCKAHNNELIKTD
ncbi:hypothetical protein CDL12_06794 [Handroanthus impetiginosus]|uniref:Uncharacterized protein n=1 Tax=Handroanthus impetiginosus TaxID=429701 RepID=A0A2G9HSK4_9LAMI|nr:hypothetical protein CDL12_06794 [Handroanthus impetiginosus]